MLPILNCLEILTISVKNFGTSTCRLSNKDDSYKFPLKGSTNTTMWTYLSTAKLEGVLEAMKIEILQISSTDNPPPNLTSSKPEAL